MRQHSSGRFEVALPATEAIDLFTPEGERSWVPGWNPVYPTGVVDETAGTVFVTTVGDDLTIWTIIQIDRAAGAAAYGRVTPGQHAGIVRVWCFDAGAARCVVKVEYDMTGVGNDPAVLGAYEEPAFSQLMLEWSDAITASLA